MKMRLLTNEIKKSFEKHPLYSQEKKGMDAKVLVTYMLPMQMGAYFITGAKKIGDDYLLYGLAKVLCWEWGCVTLSELENMKIPYLGMNFTVEREYGKRGTVREEVEHWRSGGSADSRELDSLLSIKYDASDFDEEDK